MSVAKGANLALRFLLELCLLAAVAYWGSQVSSSTVVNVVVAIAAPVAVAGVWGLWLAPKASRRLQLPGRWLLELALLALGVLALVATDAAVLGVILAVVAVLNAFVLHAWGLDEELPSVPR